MDIFLLLQDMWRGARSTSVQVTDIIRPAGTELSQS